MPHWLLNRVYRWQSTKSSQLPRGPLSLLTFIFSKSTRTTSIGGASSVKSNASLRSWQVFLSTMRGITFFKHRTFLLIPKKWRCFLSSRQASEVNGAPGKASSTVSHAFKNLGNKIFIRAMLFCSGLIISSLLDIGGQSSIEFHTLTDARCYHWCVWRLEGHLVCPGSHSSPFSDLQRAL